MEISKRSLQFICAFSFITDFFKKTTTAHLKVFLSRMVKKTVTVKNEAGLHARPSSVLVKTASKFESDFYISMYGYKVNGKSILGVMTLAAESGAEMELIFEGEDEQEALTAISELFENKFENN